MFPYSHDIFNIMTVRKHTVTVNTPTTHPITCLHHITCGGIVLSLCTAFMTQYKLRIIFNVKNKVFTHHYENYCQLLDVEVSYNGTLSDNYWRI